MNNGLLLAAMLTASSTIAAQTCTPGDGTLDVIRSEETILKGGGKTTDVFVDFGAGIERINIARPTKDQWVYTFESASGAITKFSTSHGRVQVVEGSGTSA